MMADIGNELDLYTCRRAAGYRTTFWTAKTMRQSFRPPGLTPCSPRAIKEKPLIFIETYERHLQIRFRVDGVLRRNPCAHSAVSLRLLISRIKVMASLDIAEKRISGWAHGAAHWRARRRCPRLNAAASSYGERVVLRLLDKNSVNLDLLTLGMPPALLQQVDDLMARPQWHYSGFTGPTGREKHPLYAALCWPTPGAQHHDH